MYSYVIEKEIEAYRDYGGYFLKMKLNIRTNFVTDIYFTFPCDTNKHEMVSEITEVIGLYLFEVSRSRDYHSHFRKGHY